jgi:hypothetical protein
MAIDASIALGVRGPEFENPMNALSRALQVRQLQSQAQMNDLQMQDTMRQREETTKLNQLYAQAMGADGQIDINKFSQGAASMGLGSKLPGLQKGFADLEKANADRDKVLTEVTSRKATMYRDALSNVTDPQTAAQWLSSQYRDPHLSRLFQVPIEQAIQSIPQDPQAFQQWIQKQALGMSQYVEKNAPKITSQNLGGTERLISTPGLGGAPTVLNETRRTQTPDSLASQARLRAEAQERVTADAGGQPDLTRRFGKAQPGFRWKEDGSLEAIPGGPADQKSQATSAGKESVDNIVATLRQSYDKLDKNAGITSTDQSAVSNIGRRISQSGPGQFVGGAVGSQNQKERDSIAQARPLLLQAIMKATGMSAKQMDSNAELKLYLATATDPTLSVQANREALDRIEQLFGSGGSGAVKAPSASNSGNQAPKRIRFDAQGNVIP